GDAMLMDSDQGHSARRGRVTQARDDPRFGQAHPTLRSGLFCLFAGQQRVVYVAYSTSHLNRATSMK
ncbi:MAG: hypothetical protein AAF449_20835, partial [Myxococcota bacterium]